MGRDGTGRDGTGQGVVHSGACMGQEGTAEAVGSVEEVQVRLSAAAAARVVY